VSNYHGRERCNDFSIGIELEGTDNQPYTDAQYQQLANVTHALISLYPRLPTT
jgi:AmpD protein